MHVATEVDSVDGLRGGVEQKAMRSSRSAISCRARTSCVMSREMPETPTMVVGRVQDLRERHRDVDQRAVLAYPLRLETIDGTAGAYLLENGVDLLFAPGGYRKLA